MTRPLNNFDHFLTRARLARRYLDGNQLSGSIPTETGLLTVLVDLYATTHR